MIGAIIGDIVGSIYEFNNIKTKKFEFWGKGCEFTDDTVMTVAVADALMSVKDEAGFQTEVAKKMRDYGARYPYAGYGYMFGEWLNSKQPKPYNSFGNGSAMRVSPCGFAARSIEEALKLAEISAGVTHNHTEGMKGAKATAAAIYLAKTGESKEKIKQYVEDNFYALTETLAEIRPKYRFNETCQNTVPQAIQAFLESDSFEDAVRNAISLGGDSDTLAAITGGIAEAFYG